MYWIGFFLALASGLFAINLFRNTLRRYIPTVKEEHFDRIRIALLIVGLSITTIKYYHDQHQIKGLENQIAAVAYKEVSVYNATGNKSGAWNGIRFVSSPIDDWNKNFVTRVEGKPVCHCNFSSIDTCKAVIEKLPLYPFAYYFLALCLKEQGNGSWRQSAVKAKMILTKTTRIPDHHADHDVILAEVDKLLAVE